METEKYNHFEYGANIAKKLKPIQGQYFEATEQTNLEDLESRITSASGTILIAIDPKDSDFGWPLSDSLIEEPQYIYMIAEQTSSTDFKTILAAQDKCKLLAKEIISKMLQDAKVYKNGLQFVESGAFKILGVGPIGDNFYGVQLNISFKYGVSYFINQDLWEE